MSLELSPSQERRLHSILDRGLDTLHDSVENISRSTPVKYNWNSNLEGSYRGSSQKIISSPDQTEKSKIINSELKSLQEKLATLEAKLSKNSEVKVNKSLRNKAKSPANFNKFISENSPRIPNFIPKRNQSREKLRAIENSEKEITKLERSITPSPARFKPTVRKNEKTRAFSTKDKKIEEKLKKENDFLRKELNKMDELKNTMAKLKDDYNKLAISFERSESIRKKQKELINHLKGELRSFNEDNLSDSIKYKPKSQKIR